MAKQAATATEPTPASDNAGLLSDLTAMVSRADADAKRELMKALGVAPVIQKKPTQTNADVKRISHSVGEVQHEEGFLPKPPEKISDLGPEAVEEFHRKWKARGVANSNAAEEYAAIAQM
jgi:hypothetical protein